MRNIKNRLVDSLKSSPGVRTARSVTQLAVSYVSDARRYSVRSGVVFSERREVLEAEITMDYHRVEKGLSLPLPKPWFGREVVSRLVSNTRSYVSGDEYDVAIAAAAVGALLTYGRTFERDPIDWWTSLSGVVSEMEAQLSSAEAHYGGIKTNLDPRSLNSQNPWSFEQLAENRSSIRNFSSELVDSGAIERAVVIAQKTPSVCNRQSSRVRIYPRGEIADSILALQNGNRGFGHTASHILVVTSDLTAFVSAGERNQPFVDGGMFAMSIVYALQDQGVSTCCLNWSTTSVHDAKIRRLVSIEDGEAVIMMIAVGFAVPDAKATISQKRPLNRVILSSDPLPLESPGRVRK
ncbi:nitroreductase family protein [Rhodococcus sp. ARC_M6]|uniref:nitroreductase family protein n=1 Tax=Rhodococcus sp. ARC_M6 TaxID=2928852 RepID=UPI001FB429E2|nr:nitroreductase family protein [Rhodococcus sp. ARC_M6]MCJ0902131.1 nitroreductase family protein [Rhodococcus sp. ARC_M6]